MTSSLWESNPRHLACAISALPLNDNTFLYFYYCFSLLSSNSSLVHCVVCIRAAGCSWTCTYSVGSCNGGAPITCQNAESLSACCTLFCTSLRVGSSWQITVDLEIFIVKLFRGLHQPRKNNTKYIATVCAYSVLLYTSSSPTTTW